MPQIHYDLTGAGASELTEEMARFLSRANCLAAIHSYTADEHGDPPHESMSLELKSKLRARQRRSLSPAAAGLLRIAWQTELAARFASAFEDPALKRVSAQTLPVNSYYAVFNCRRALGHVVGSRLDQHRAVADDFAGQARRFPRPWSIRLDGDPDDLEACKLTPPIVEPYALASIKRGHPSADYIWGALRMARRWKLELVRDSWIRQNRNRDGSKRQRLPPGMKSKLALGLRATTLHDFLWELRRRANYESADEYTSEVADNDFVRFHDGLISLLDTAMLIAETELAHQVGPKALDEAAAEWMRGARRAGTWATQPLEMRIDAIRAAG